MATFEARPDPTIGNAVQVQAGVSKGPNPLADAAVDIFSGISNIVGDRRESKNQKFLAEFEAQQISIADAYDQGKIPTAQAATSMMRRKYLEALQANPALREELQSSQGFLTTTIGAGKVVSDMTSDEQNIRRMEAAAFDDGYLRPDMSDAERGWVMNNYANLKESDNNLRREMANADAVLKGFETERAADNIVVHRQEQAARNWIRTNSSMEMQRIQNEITTVLEDTNMTNPERAAEIDRIESQFRSTMSAIAVDTDNSPYFAAAMAPYDRMFTQSREIATGARTAKDLRTEMDNITAVNEWTLMQDSGFASIVAASKLAIGQDVSDLVDIPLNSLEILGRNFATTGGAVANPYPTGEEELEGVDGANNFIRSNAARTDLSVEEQQEVFTQIQSTLQGASDNEGIIAKEAIKGRPLVQMLADPNIGEVLINNSEALSENLDGAYDVLSRHYNNDVATMVRDNWHVGVMSILDENGEEVEVSMNDAFDMVMDSTGGIRVVPKEGAVPGDVRQLRGAARRAQNLMGAAISEVVMSVAHMNGHKNYQAEFETMKQVILDPNFEAAGEQTINSQEDLNVERIEGMEAPVPEVPRPRNFPAARQRRD